MHKENRPLVSVIMATFNEPEKFISEAIPSILDQTYSNIELIIADDSTKEETTAVIDKFALKDNRVKVIRSKSRMGFVPALNIGLRTAKGGYIARMDGDDIAVSDRFEQQITYLESHPDIDVLGGAMNVINEHSEVTALRTYPKGGIKLLAWMSLRDPVGHPTVMFRRKIVEEGNIYDEYMNKGCEDTEFWFRLRNKGYKIQNLQIPLINYRITVDMADKRDRDNMANYIARKKNFSWKYLPFDCLSLLSIKSRMALPSSIISWLYSKENHQKY